MRNWQTITAIALVMGGSLSLAAAFETAVVADCTVSVEYSPSLCNHAHEEPNVSGSDNTVCEFEVGRGCVVPPGSGCGASYGWGIAIPGKCDLQEDLSSAPHHCVEGYGVTAVTLHKWETACLHDGPGRCTCYAFKSETDLSTTEVPVCDCRDWTL